MKQKIQYLHRCAWVLLAFVVVGASSLLCSSCDEGDIYPKDTAVDTSGLTVTLKARITGVASWSSAYNVVLAGFSENSPYAIVQKNVPTNVADGEETTVTLTGFSNEVETVEFCVTTQLGERIVTFASAQLSEAVDNQLLIDAGTVDAGMYHTIQTQVFDITCATCHGGSNRTAADLNLTQGNSYAMLVNHASTKLEGETRVVPGNAPASVLHRVISGEDLGFFDHGNMVKNDLFVTLIDRWITNGAKE